MYYNVASQILALIAAAVGMFSVLVFHGLLERPRRNANRKPTRNRALCFDKIRKFCRSVHLYQVAVVFTACKLLINIALVYIPLFINESAIGESGTIASVPLVAYVSSLVTSMTVQHVKPYFKSGKVSVIEYVR